MDDYFGLRNPLLYGDKQRPFATEALTSSGPQQTSGLPDLMGIRQAVLRQQMARQGRTPAQQLMALSPAPSLPPKRSLGDRISGMLPTAGTPEAAGLGAAGQRMLQLSGWSDRPVAMSQILGEAAKAYTTARKETAAEQAATLRAQQELERQRQKDILDRRFTEAKISEIYNKSPDQTALIQNLIAAGIDPNSDEGRQIIIDSILKGGGTDISVSVGGEPELDKGNIKALQMEVVKGTRTLDTLNEIKQSYRPEFQEIPTRIGVAWSALKEKAGGELTADETQLLTDFSIYRQNAINAVNNYIRDITGAQMSVAEAERLAKALPQPGVGLFDGDSPSVFKAKLDNAIRQIELIRQRNAYFLYKGIDPTFDYRPREFQSEDDIPALKGEAISTNVAYKINGRTINATDYDLNRLKKEEATRLLDQYKDLPEDQRKIKVGNELKSIFGLG